MKSLWRYMLVIFVSVKCVSTQCIDGTCECHCTCCRFCGRFRDSFCDICEAGWSGTINNRCQIKNVAYKATAVSSSTYGNFIAMNAVDDDPYTYALTTTEKNPQLTLTLSNIHTIKRIYSIIKEEIYATFYVYVTNSTLATLTDINMCNYFYATRKTKSRNITCTKTLTGDQIVITTNSTKGRLVVFEIQVYECSQGTYGDLCQRQCNNCLNSKCDGDTGICLHGCSNGWHGTKCETKCNTNCLNNICDQATGFCTTGCTPGMYGNTCDMQCPLACQSSSCDRVIGCTACLPGYSRSDCQQCSGNTYGQNCSFTCQNCFDCNHIEGCKECANGFYGDQCDLSCPQQCIREKCEIKSGNCAEGCKDGFMGIDCGTSCKGNCATCTINDPCLTCISGSFGKQCENSCPQTCSNNTCVKINGHCFNCLPGTFGTHCSENCSKNCLPAFHSVCGRNGDCINGCMDGWLGPQCDKKCSIENCVKCNLKLFDIYCETCNVGFYLNNGQEKCVRCPSNCATCVNELICTRCLPNFTGEQCMGKCNVHCAGNLCNIDGTCTHGCISMFDGCSEDCGRNCMHCYNKYSCKKCLPGFYLNGLACRGTCPVQCVNCTSYYDCDACKPGFYGSWCNDECHPQCLTCDSGDSCTSCRDGWSGRLCQCSDDCEICDDYGLCLSGCKDSYYGERCNVPCPSKDCQRCEQMSGNCTECSKGLYGGNCTEQCSKSCLGSACDMNGRCLQGFKDDFAAKCCNECKY